MIPPTPLEKQLDEQKRRNVRIRELSAERMVKLRAYETVIEDVINLYPSLEDYIEARLNEELRGTGVTDYRLALARLERENGND